MKKIFSMAALFAAGLLGFTSCSNEDLAQGGTPDAQTLASNGIYFKVDDNSAKSPLAKGPLLSRAAGVTTTSLTNIYVQATNSENAVYFGDGTPELFTYDGSSVFRSTTNHYWPNNNADGANNTLNFYASNQQETLTAGTQANPSPIVDDYECDGIKDWVTATVKAGEKTIPYPLTFQHVLSQIKITAEAKDKTQDLVYKVVGVKLSAPDTGDYQFANATAGVGTWTIDNSSSADYTYEQNMNGTFNPTAATEAEQTWASTDYFNILPVTSGTLTFDVQYQVIQNGQVIGDFTGANSKQVTVDAPNLLSGKIYTYNFVLAINSNDVITFTVSTNSWTDGSTTDVQVPQVLNFVNPTIETSSVIAGGEYNNFILNYANEGGGGTSLVYWDIENIKLFEPEKFHVVIDGVDFPYNPSELALAKSQWPNILSISTTPVDAVTNTTNVPLTEFTLMECSDPSAPGKYCVVFYLHPQHNRHTSIVYEVYYENILLAKFTNNVD